MTNDSKEPSLVYNLDLIETPENYYGAVYCAINLVNNKLYIGQTLKNRLKRRIYEHYIQSEKYINKTYFYSAIKKYGLKNFKWTILYFAQNKKELNEAEVYWIKSLDTINRNKGYNMTFGGENLLNLTEESRQLQRKRNAESKRTPEARENQRIKHLGKISKTKGIPRPDEQGSNHSRARKVELIETKEQFGCIMEVEIKYGYDSHVIGACCRGKIMTAYGNHWRYIEDNITIEKIESRRKEINLKNISYVKKRCRCLETNITYNSLSEAAIATGTRESSISLCCNNKRNRANGLHWQYENSSLTIEDIEKRRTESIKEKRSKNNV